MKITLENQNMRIELNKIESYECGTYLLALLQSNKVQGMTYHDDINDTDIIKAWGTNESIYYALTQIQDESSEGVFTIE